MLPLLPNEPSSIEAKLSLVVATVSFRSSLNNRFLFDLAILDFLFPAPQSLDADYPPVIVVLAAFGTPPAFALCLPMEGVVIGSAHQRRAESKAHFRICISNPSPAPR
jgi:hypothetical protein